MLCNTVPMRPEMRGIIAKLGQLRRQGRPNTAIVADIEPPKFKTIEGSRYGTAIGYAVAVLLASAGGYGCSVLERFKNIHRFPRRIVGVHKPGGANTPARGIFLTKKPPLGTPLLVASSRCN